MFTPIYLLQRGAAALVLVGALTAPASADESRQTNPIDFIQSLPGWNYTGKFIQVCAEGKVEPMGAGKVCVGIVKEDGHYKVDGSYGSSLNLTKNSGPTLSNGGKIGYGYTFATPEGGLTVGAEVNPVAGKASISGGPAWGWNAPKSPLGLSLSAEVGMKFERPKEPVAPAPDNRAKLEAMQEQAKLDKMNSQQKFDYLMNKLSNQLLPPGPVPQASAPRPKYTIGMEGTPKPKTDNWMKYAYNPPVIQDPVKPLLPKYTPPASTLSGSTFTPKIVVDESVPKPSPIRPQGPASPTATVVGGGKFGYDEKAQKTLAPTTQPTRPQTQPVVTPTRPQAQPVATQPTRPQTQPVATPTPRPQTQPVVTPTRPQAQPVATQPTRPQTQVAVAPRPQAQPVATPTPRPQAQSTPQIPAQRPAPLGQRPQTASLNLPK